MKNESANDKALVKYQSGIKDQENVKAANLSTNLNEAVEKSLVKSSCDEAQSSPR